MYTAKNVMSTEQIDALHKEIYAYCGATYDADVPAAVVYRATALEGYLNTTGKMWADAKWHYDSQLQSEFLDGVRKALAAGMATSTMNKYIDSLCKDLAHLVAECERLNRTVTHQLSLMVTLISKHKAEFQANQLNNYGQRA